MNNINNLQEQFENLIKQGQELLEKMKENHISDTSKKVKRLKPKDRDIYYVFMSDGNIRTCVWDGDVVDCGYYNVGNCFKTEEEAQKELERRLAEVELLDLCDWEGGMFYSINYYGSDNSFDWLVGNGSIFSPYRFKSVESVKKAIETLGTEKLKLIFRID